MIVKMDKVKVQDRYSNKYKALLADLSKLTPATAVLYPIPKGTPWQKMYDRIASILDYRKIKAPDGFMYSRAMSKDGKNVVITLRSRGNGHRTKKRKRPSKGAKRRKVISKVTGLKPSAVALAEKMARATRAKGTLKVNKLQAEDQKRVADEQKAKARKLKAERDARYRAKKKAAATMELEADRIRNLHPTMFPKTGE